MITDSRIRVAREGLLSAESSPSTRHTLHEPDVADKPTITSRLTKSVVYRPTLLSRVRCTIRGSTGGATAGWRGGPALAALPVDPLAVNADASRHARERKAGGRAHTPSAALTLQRLFPDQTPGSAHQVAGSAAARYRAKVGVVLAIVPVQRVRHRQAQA